MASIVHPPPARQLAVLERRPNEPLTKRLRCRDCGGEGSAIEQDEDGRESAYPVACRRCDGRGHQRVPICGLCLGILSFTDQIALGPDEPGCPGDCEVGS